MFPSPVLHFDHHLKPAQAVKAVYTRIFSNYFAMVMKLMSSTFWTGRVSDTTAAIVTAISSTNPPEQITTGLDAFIFCHLRNWLPTHVHDAMQRWLWL